MPQGGNDLQASPHGPLGIIFVRLWVTKVHQQAIPQVLGDMPVKTLDNLRTDLLIRLDDVT